MLQYKITYRLILQIINFAKLAADFFLRSFKIYKSTNLVQHPTEKRFILRNGRLMSVENLFDVKPESGHENSIYFFIF